MKAALPLAKILATASCRNSKTGPWTSGIFACKSRQSIIELDHDDIMTWNASGINDPLWEESTVDTWISFTKVPIMQNFSRANLKHGEQIVENDHVQRAIDISSPIFFITPTIDTP